MWYGDTYAMDMGIPLGLKAGGTITEETKQSVMDEASKFLCIKKKAYYNIAITLNTAGEI